MKEIRRGKWMDRESCEFDGSLLAGEDSCMVFPHMTVRMSWNNDVLTISRGSQSIRLPVPDFATFRFALEDIERSLAIKGLLPYACLNDNKGKEEY